MRSDTEPTCNDCRRTFVQTIRTLWQALLRDGYEFDAEGATNEFQVDGEIANLRLVDAETTALIWEEPTVSLDATGSFDAAADRLELSAARMSSGAS